MTILIGGESIMANKDKKKKEQKKKKKGKDK